MREFIYLSLDDIDLENRLFEINYLPDMTMLKTSVERQGILHPIHVRKINKNFEENIFQIISGFRRYECAKILGFQTIPTLIDERKASELFLFESVIEENTFHRTFNIIEKSIALEKLRNRFGMEMGEVVRKYMPLLGLERSEKLFRFHQEILHSDECLKNYWVNHKLPIHLIDDFLRFDLAGQRALISCVMSLHFSISYLKEFLIGCYEIILREKISVQTLLSEAYVREIFGDERLDIHAKREKLREYLKQRRYPRLAHLETTFGELKNRLKLPLDPPVSFESNEIQMKISFKNKKEFDGWIRKMKDALETDELNKLFQIL